MSNWIDENTIEGELSQDDFLAKVNAIMSARVQQETQEKRPGNYGNDGIVPLYEEKCQHLGIHYLLKVIGYFAVDRLLNGKFRLRGGRGTGIKGFNRIGKHIVVEHSLSIPCDLSEFLGLSEFLWCDTIHAGQEEWTLQKQWEWAEAKAKTDCQRISTLDKEFEDKVATLQSELYAFLPSLKKGEE